MSSTIKSITLDYGGKEAQSMAQERDRAIADLCEDGQFKPSGDSAPPYSIHLMISGKQLVFTITDSAEKILPQLILSLSPYRTIIKDYFLMIDSYDEARLAGNQVKLEPIDMARPSQ